MRKRHWLWNLFIVLTVIACIIAFAAHYKNWTRIRSDDLTILSGLFYKELKFSDMDSITMVARIPHMERIHGFSAWAMEKGVFRDSLHPDNRVSVYVDDLKMPKIRIVYHDSLQVFLNFTDSLKTREMYQFLEAKVDSILKETPG